jgi:hypothetical protein
MLSVITDSRHVSHETLELIRKALAGLRFGEVVIAVHDGEVVQIARTEKVRPGKDKPPPRSVP